MLLALSSASLLHAATLTVSVTSGGGGTYFGLDAVTSATLDAADGDTIEFLEAGNYLISNTITLDGSKSLSFVGVPANRQAILLKESGGSPYLQLQADNGAPTYSFTNLQVINTNYGETLTAMQNATNSLTLNIDACRLEGSQGIRYEGAPGVANPGDQIAPITFNFTDSIFNSHRDNTFSTGSFGGNTPSQFMTLIATNCTFLADDGTGFVTPGDEEKGDHAFIFQSNRPFLDNVVTITDSRLQSNITVFRGNSGGAGEFARNAITFTNTEFVTNGVAANQPYINIDYGGFGSEDNTITFDRCSIIPTSGTAQARGLRINIGDENATTPTLVNTVNVFNSIVMSGGSTTSTLTAISNQSTPIFLEGVIDANLYHNNIGHRDSGLDAVGFPVRMVLAPSNTLDVQNNIFYNLGAAGGDAILRNENGSTLIEDSHLIIGTTNSTVTLLSNNVFENVADPVEGVDIGEDFVTLSTGASASAVDAANTPGNTSVANAVSLLDRDSILRYADSPAWDIGAYEVNPVPVELGTFSLE